MVGLIDFFFLDRFSKIRVEIFKLLYILKALILFILHIADMVAKKLIFLAAFVMLITLLEQIKSGVHGRMAKPKKAGRVKVIHTGPRVRKLKKKVKELEKQLASMEPCERKKQLTTLYYFLFNYTLLFSLTTSLKR